jgi:hypothetical protein
MLLRVRKVGVKGVLAVLNPAGVGRFLRFAPKNSRLATKKKIPAL